MKKIIVLIIFILLISTVFAAMEPTSPYCEHQGYTVDQRGDSRDTYYCIFDDGSECLTGEFYAGYCGQEYVKDFPCRQEGEVFFPEFEECCEGLESSNGWFHMTVGQPQCVEEKGFFEKLWNWLFRWIRWEK
mgnify:FL=1